MDLEKIKRLVKINVKYYINSLRYNSQNCSESNVTCVIFSRNRAMQLDALLESIERYSKAKFNIIVQYSYSPNHQKSYEEVEKKYPYVKFWQETTVNATLKEILKSIKSKYMFYLVDDQVFVGDFDVYEAIPFVDDKSFFSMRLGKNITNWGIKDVPLVPKYNEKGRLLHWKFSDNKGQHDWHYKFSVDGHIYRTIDILRCTMAIPFKAPNSYEANMNSVLFFKTAKYGSAFSQPVVVNLIINACREEAAYENCVGGEFSADDMLKLRENGKSLDLDAIARMNFNCTHFIVKDINSILK